MWGNECTEIILNGSPRAHSEHSGVLPGAKYYAGWLEYYNVKNKLSWIRYSSVWHGKKPGAK